MSDKGRNVKCYLENEDIFMFLMRFEEKLLSSRKCEQGKENYH